MKRLDATYFDPAGSLDFWRPEDARILPIVDSNDMGHHFEQLWRRWDRLPAINCSSTAWFFVSVIVSSSPSSNFC